MPKIENSLLQKANSKVCKKYAQKMSNKMYAIDRKYERIEANLEKDKEREKERRTKRLNDQMKKELVAVKFGREVKKTNHEKQKAETTTYHDACRLAQLSAKLRDTDNEGVGECICCPGVPLPRGEMNGGHFLPKGGNKSVALDHRNINAQNEKCNAIRGGAGRQDAQKPQIDKKRGVGTVADLEMRASKADRLDPLSYIRENIDTIEMMLDAKTFDVSSYRKEIARMKRKYLPPVL